MAGNPLLSMQSQVRVTAPSNAMQGRSKCKACKGAIGNGEMRLGLTQNWQVRALLHRDAWFSGTGELTSSCS